MVATSQFDVEPLSFGRRNVHSTISWAQSQMSFNGRDNVKPTANSRRWQKERETFEGGFFGRGSAVAVFNLSCFSSFFCFCFKSIDIDRFFLPPFFFLLHPRTNFISYFFSFESLFIDVVFVSLSLPLSLRSRVDVTGYLRVEPEPARDHCVLRGGMGDWWSVCVCVYMGDGIFFLLGGTLCGFFFFYPLHYRLPKKIGQL